MPPHSSSAPAPRSSSASIDGQVPLRGAARRRPPATASTAKCRCAPPSCRSPPRRRGSSRTSTARCRCLHVHTRPRLRTLRLLLLSLAVVSSSSEDGHFDGHFVGRCIELPPCVPRPLAGHRLLLSRGRPLRAPRTATSSGAASNCPPASSGLSLGIVSSSPDGDEVGDACEVVEVGTVEIRRLTGLVTGLPDDLAAHRVPPVCRTSPRQVGVALARRFCTPRTASHFCPTACLRWARSSTHSGSPGMESRPRHFTSVSHERNGGKNAQSSANE